MPTFDVTPSKHIYNALVQDIDANQAISDLIDNAIDNAKVQKKTTLEISITVTENKIEVKDNSGGLDLSTIPLLLMPGGTNRSGGAGIKGIWGVGSKRAMFSLGEKISIKTRKSGQIGLILELDESWFQEDESTDKWKVDYEEDSSLEEGITTITLTDLKVILNDYSISTLRKYIAKTNKDEIEDESLTILFNSEKVKFTLEEPWSKSEYTPPSRYTTDIPVIKSDRKLHFKMTLGIMTRPGEDYSYGIDFIGNKRVILRNNLDWRMGFKKERLGFPHPTINRFKAIVRVSGDSRDIPWDSAKSDINENHPMYRSITDLVFQISRQYVSFLRKNYEATSKLFKETAKETDIKDINFEYGKEFKKAVKDYKEPIEEEGISFKVPAEEFGELVKYFGLQGKTKKDIGLFIFNRVWKEVKGDVED